MTAIAAVPGDKMKYLLQFTRILCLAFVSEILHAVLPLPVPASIYGIILLFILLETGIMPADHVRETGRFLIEIMPVMFIPAAVGILDAWDLIAPNLAAYAVVIFVSTAVVMAAAGLVTQAVIRRGRKKDPESQGPVE